MTIVARDFTVGGKYIGSQYVSHINSKGEPVGYDRLRKYALDLTDWQAARVAAYLRSIGAAFETEGENK